MDVTDRKLLSLLQQNAKLTMKELSNELGLSITPIYERLKRLERNKTILGYEARVDESQAGFALEVYCCVTLESHKSEFLSNFKSEIQKFDEVMECYHLTGSFDFLLKVLVKDMDAYAAFVNNRLSKLQNVGLVQSMMVLDRVKRKSILPAF
ncbi:MAG: Lrp/AsnC family transcriptional regulator [Cyclobacteriaceae bacterium]